MDAVQIQAQLDRYNVRIIPKPESWLMRACGRLLGEAFMRSYWTTIRFPGCAPCIYHPAAVANPSHALSTLRHELHHVRQFAPWYGPWGMAALYLLVPLPVGFSGRWYVERWPYLGDILAGRRTIEGAVETLHTGYLYPWPRGLMRAWFEHQVRVHQ